MPDEHPIRAWNDATLLHLVGPTANAVAQCKEFLQGYLSSNTDRLSVDRALPTALCNLQGRVIASGWAIEESNGVGLIVHASLADEVRAFLRPYVTFSKCDMRPDNGHLLITNNGGELVPGLSVMPVDTVPNGAIDGSDEAAAALNDARFVFVSDAVSSRFLPQMLGLADAQAVDFDKGCYLGQEIVARAQFRGAVKRRLATRDLATDPDGALAVGQALDDKSIIVQVASGRPALVVTPV